MDVPRWAMTRKTPRRILADLITHPNAGGVLVLGLGCENSNIDVLKDYIGEYDEKRVKFLVCQDSEDEVADALKLIEELVEYAAPAQREPISCKELIVGMKCGGSDGLSGITANPTVGAFSDLLISKGGTTILTEVPEMFGAETLLMNRCENPELFHKTVDLINDFKNYFKSHDQTIYENPSPGNKKGGIYYSEKTNPMGCTQKSGSAPVRGVLAYGEKVCEKGLNLLSAPRKRSGRFYSPCRCRCPYHTVHYRKRNPPLLLLCLRLRFPVIQRFLIRNLTGSILTVALWLKEPICLL